MLRPLPVPAMEQLARNLARLELRAGDRVFASGDQGDRFYVIERGRVQVRDGRRLVRTMGPGQGFGEIALLRDVPRTMTVDVAENAVLRTVRRADFLLAVTGFGEARAAASAAMSRHLDHAEGAAGYAYGAP